MNHLSVDHRSCDWQSSVDLTRLLADFVDIASIIAAISAATPGIKAKIAAKLAAVPNAAAAPPASGTAATGTNPLWHLTRGLQRSANGPSSPKPSTNVSVILIIFAKRSFLETTLGVRPSNLRYGHVSKSREQGSTATNPAPPYISRRKLALSPPLSEAYCALYDDRFGSLPVW